MACLITDENLNIVAEVDIITAYYRVLKDLFVLSKVITPTKKFSI